MKKLFEVGWGVVMVGCNRGWGKGVGRMEEKEVGEYEIGEIELVIVELYGFEDRVGRGGGEEEMMEKIDIGGM